MPSELIIHTVRTYETKPYTEKIPPRGPTLDQAVKFGRKTLPTPRQQTPLKTKSRLTMQVTPKQIPLTKSLQQPVLVTVTTGLNTTTIHRPLTTVRPRPTHTPVTDTQPASRPSGGTTPRASTSTPTLTQQMTMARTTRITVTTTPSESGTQNVHPHLPTVPTSRTVLTTRPLTVIP